jgi:dCTP deaminase
MTILCDEQIRDLAEDFQMIEPFYQNQINKVELSECSPARFGLQGRKLISFGLSSYGYDIRLSPNDFRIFRHVPGTVVDPKNFTPENLEPVTMQSDAFGDYFIIPAHSYGLGVAMEKLNMPRDITAICMGKSTYARCGIIANVTPAEAGWTGNLTLEISNSSRADCRVYAGEGICQLLFLKGDPCNVSYSDRAGKYQGQGERITLAKV